MDYSYNNYNNEEVRLNLKVGDNWDNLNIQNKYLNTIFSKIDDGDRKISADELSLLERLLEKSNNLVRKISIFGSNKKKEASKLLKDENLKSVVEQIENGKIALPKKRELTQTGYIEMSYNSKEYDEIKKDSKSFYENQINKIKARLAEKYSGDYEINVYQLKNGYKYEIFDLDTNRIKNNQNKTFSQSFTKIRSDGISLEITDCYKNEVVDDEAVDYSKNHQAANFGEIVITDKKGKEHKISYNLNDCFDKDALDCRRVRDKALNLLNKLPSETIEKLLENGVEEISFSAEYDDLLSSEPDYYKKQMDKDGNVIDIIDTHATIISPELKLEKRNYKTERNIKRDDNINIGIVDTKKNSAKMNIDSKKGDTFSINIIGSSGDIEGNKFHQWQLPRLERIMSTLPASVLKDLANEVTDIKFLQKRIGNDGAGLYSPGSNSIAFRADADSETPTISFVHELGHAIDDQNGTFLSSKPEFAQKFEKFQQLYTKFFPNKVNHACDNAQEFFASTYAYLELPNDTDNNHIGDLDALVNDFKNSKNNEEQELYKLFTELKQDVNNNVNMVRKQPKNLRADSSISQLVKNNCDELIKKFNKYGDYLELNFDSQSMQIDLTRALADSDNVFDSYIKKWKNFAEDKRTSFIGEHLPTPPEIQELYSELIQKAQELRAKVKK